MRRRLLIIGCSATKRTFRAPANELYLGPVWLTFNKHRVRAAGELSVLALSAKHGLIPFRTSIDPYDLRMDAERALELRPVVLERLSELRAEWGEWDEALVVAGKTYLEALHGPEGDLRNVPARVVRVAAGGIGHKRQELKAWLLEGVERP
jgi:hypothetical protein